MKVVDFVKIVRKESNNGFGLKECLVMLKPTGYVSRDGKGGWVTKDIPEEDVDDILFVFFDIVRSE